MLCVCVCVCVYACMYIDMYIYIYSIYIYIHTHVYMKSSFEKKIRNTFFLLRITSNINQTAVGLF